jgi:endo-1,4-beta-xylanase
VKTSRKLSFLFAALAVPLLAQTPSGSLVFPAESTASFRLNGMDPRNWTTRPSSDARFPTIWNLKTPFPASSNPYDFRLVGTPSAPIRKGETLLATFWMRTISAAYGEGHTRFVVERGRPPYPKSAEWFASAGPEWTLFQIPFVAAEDDAPAGFSAQFWISSGPQEIEIAGFRLVNYGAGVPFTSLGLERYPYPNAAPNAAWREAARARIERLRKGDFLFVLRDPDGKPLANRKMRARMVRHSFGFGTAVDARTLLEDTPNGQRYRDHFFNNFNRATLENDLKWSEWRRDRALALRALDFLRDRGIRQLRGHTVVWPGWAYLPEDVKAAENNPAELRRLVDAHIQDIVGATRGKLTEWDVLNEPYTNRDLERILGLPSSPAGSN